MYAIGPLDVLTHTPVDEKPQRLCAMLAKRRHELLRVQTAVASLYMDVKNGDISVDDYSFMKALFDKQMRALSVAVARLRIPTGFLISIKTSRECTDPPLCGIALKESGRSI